ncbi:AMP-binding protein [Pseudonocardia parietis]|uniref:Acyl-CoA synthetase (AMP-forming)/AMP-acid ligase II n=1 Tax=Pseudonocardia parietis TaxID=570936 RepID=A0ABS4W6J4_9PSEU|nr:AMP-binding protein [Pseudonocardia parietis]MBP2371818.1 acyl-CoA synthetase (AMP-forming)/AMP-acid ligase II [Pseudonocardia parietis]
MSAEPALGRVAPRSEPTLHERLDAVAADSPDQVIRFHSDRSVLTYAELVASSKRMAARLHAAPGDAIGILAPNGPEFLQTVFAASRLGAAVCPLPLPAGLRDLAEYGARTARIVAAAAMSHLVVSNSVTRMLGARAAQFGAGTLHDSTTLTTPGPELPPRTVDPATPAVLQFTSGSTAAPKGVVLTHTNILACAESITEAIAIGPGDAHASWLPLFHDMGLFGTLTGIFTGIPINLWNPTAFVKDPGRWLAEFAATRSTISTMPNFAFDALLDTPQQDLDLAAWRVCFNGAEIIRPESIAAFATRFEHAGFRAEAMTPGYGMAEATLVATLPPLGRAPIIDCIDREALAGATVVAPRASGTAKEIVGLGRPVPGMAIRIAGGAPEGTVGEIELRGAAVTSGYLDGSRPFTEDGWLRTGDLGYLRAGELFFVGRTKEMITVRGVNIYPADVEAEAAAIDGVRRGRCVALAVLEPCEHIAIVVETAAPEAEHEALRHAISARIRRALDLSALTVHLTAPDSLPRTTSGKLRRLATAALLER